MHFFTPFPVGTQKSLKNTTFKTEILKKRVARGSKAGGRLHQMYLDPEWDGRFVTREEPITGDIPLVTDHLVLTLFNDFSALLSKRTPDGLVAYPQILCLNGVMKTHDLDCLKLVPHGAHAVSLDKSHDFEDNVLDMVAEYKQGLSACMTWMAEHLDALPIPVDPRQTQEGFWPSFAPIPPLKEDKKERAQLILDRATQGLYTLLPNAFTSPPAITVYGPTNDYPCLSKGLEIRFHDSWASPNKARNKLVRHVYKSILSHPDFPLQGKDWIEGVVVYTDNGEIHPKKVSLRAYAKPSDSAHDHFGALAFLSDWADPTSLKKLQEFQE